MTTYTLGTAAKATGLAPPLKTPAVIGTLLKADLGTESMRTPAASLVIVLLVAVERKSILNFLTMMVEGHE